MKRSLKLIIMLLLTTLCTGCIKMNFSMDIKNDKSMNLVIIEALDEEFADKIAQDESVDGLLTDKDISKLESQGFLIKKYKENGQVGYTISKNYPNIDILSTEQHNITFDLNLDDLSEKESDLYFFSIKKGFFKNVYTTKLNIADADEQISNPNTDESNEFTDIDDEISDSLNKEFEDEFNQIKESMDLKFMVNLPYKSLSSNATSIENGGKSLIWDFTEFKDDTVNFQFVLYNMTNIYIVGGIALIIIILIITFIINSNRKLPIKKYDAQNETTFFQTPSSNQYQSNISNYNDSYNEEPIYNNFNQTNSVNRNESTITPFLYSNNQEQNQNMNNTQNLQATSYFSQSLTEPVQTTNYQQNNIFTTQIEPEIPNINNNQIDNSNNKLVENMFISNPTNNIQTNDPINYVNPTQIDNSVNNGLQSLDSLTENNTPINNIQNQSVNQTNNLNYFDTDNETNSNNN